jgi:predicted TIM-barrel fold metal-dependent hydrolase
LFAGKRHKTAGLSREEIMPTRRSVVLGTVATALAAQSRVALARASQPETPVNFEVPLSACDCHAHIFGDPEKFPFFVGRPYTPETALPEEMAALHKTLHIQRVVIVTNNVYGTDNSATLYGMKARGADARGVAAIDANTPESDLDSMDRAGIRGIRFNLATGGTNDPAVARQRFETGIDRVKGRGWHLQLYANLKIISALKDQFAAAPVPIVFDHFAGAQAALGPDQPGFSDVLDLMRSGKVYVKISAAYRGSRAAPDYSDVIPLAKALIAANPERILWGSDWPHPDPVTPPGKKPTDVTPLLQVDDGRLFNQLPVWAPDAAVREKILVTNPARLYGFEGRRA